MSEPRIGYQTKSAAIYDILKQRMLTGQIPAGEKLNQSDLAKSLGTSVTPLREALRRLESEGYVRNDAHRNVVVLPLELGDLRHLFAVKEELEVFAGKLASRHATAEERSVILRHAAPGTADDEEEPLSEWYQNKRFHRSIYLASANPLLIGIIESVWERHDRYWNFFDEIVFYDQAAQDEHRAIAEAVSRGDEVEVERLIRQHHRHGYKVFTAQPDGARAQHG